RRPHRGAMSCSSSSSPWSPSASRSCPGWSGGSDAATYLGRNGGFLATVPLALWVAYARATPAGARALVVVLSAGLLLHANLALHRPGDANVLALMHLPILQWTLVALAFLGDGWRERGRRVEFVRCGTELLIFTLLLTGGGVI